MGSGDDGCLAGVLRDMKEYTEKTEADQGFFNPSIPPFLFNDGGSGRVEETGMSPILDDGDINATIGENVRGWNMKIIEYPGTGEKEVRYYTHGYSGANRDRDWDTERNEDLTPDEREKLDKRNVRRSVRRTKQKIYQLARANHWGLFGTMTFDPEKVDRKDYDACRKKVRNQFTKMRRHYPDLKYLALPEQDKKGGYHWHALISGLPRSALTDSGRVDSGGKTIYNIDKYTVGWTTATEVGDSAKAANYICKYITKELHENNRGRHRYMRSDGLDEPIEHNVLMSEADQHAYYFEHLEDMQHVNDVRIEHGDYHERIIYAQYRKLTAEEKQEMKNRDMERVKKRIREERAEILCGIERRAP